MKITSFLNDIRGMGRIWWIIIVVIVLITAAGLGTMLGVYYTPGKSIGQNMHEIFSPPFEGKKVVRILMLGEDDSTVRSKKAERGLSDTIMLASFDLDAKKVSILSIPRDTAIEIDGKTRKINTAFKVGGAALSEESVANLVGVKPDYYVETNLHGFRKTVDIVGGVDIDVEKDMHYTDHWGGLYINLKKGKQHMNGEKAMEYVRFRHDAMGDIWRVGRQQTFMKAMVKRIKMPFNWIKLPRIIASVKSNIDTDLSVKDLIELAKLSGQLDLAHAKTATLPGLPNHIGDGSFWVVDPEKTATIVQDLFYSKVIPGLPKVEVLNGSGTTGAAETVAASLKKNGFEVVTIGNAKSFEYSTTQVISRKKDLKNVDQIANLVYPAKITIKPTPKAVADVTVIIGRDCALLTKKEQNF